MSILIKNMEMPKNCYDCPFVRQSFGYDYYCVKGSGTEDDIKKLYSKRMDDCPLIELPPHGRLKDVDRIEYENVYFEDVGESYEIVGKDDIDELPTVIEAEGSEE